MRREDGLVIGERPQVEVVNFFDEGELQQKKLVRYVDQRIRDYLPCELR